MAGLRVRGLRVVLPDGRGLIEDLSLEVAPGEVAVLLGGSGTGKSTFARVLFERDSLERDGFEIEHSHLEFQAGDLGLVPQRGALFDHLDVRGNIDLAMRYGQRAAAPSGADDDVPSWLERVGLDPDLARPGVNVGRLSGGQAQRVAVARALASERRLLFLDEPSVGLDPHRVRVLARLLRQQVRELGASAIVVTHDVALAAGCGDRLYALDPAQRKAVLLFENSWPGPLEDQDLTAGERGRWLADLEHELVELIAASEVRPADRPPARSRSLWWNRQARRLVDGLTAPFAVAATSLARAPGQLVHRTRDFGRIAARVSMQALVRPLPFYLVVSVLIGYTVLYVISKVGGAGVRPDALVRQIGGSYVVALAPPLSAMLFVAASGSATNAWLGAMDLSKQVLALEALGVDRRSYLWAPALVTLALCYLLVALLFGAGMVAGGLLVCHQYDIVGGLELLSGDLLDPRPERMDYAIRAGFLVWIYGWGIASDVVAKGSAQKPDADAVTRAMTGSVVASTTWVVLWELLTVLWVIG